MSDSAVVASSLRYISFLLKSLVSSSLAGAPDTILVHPVGDPAVMAFNVAFLAWFRRKVRFRAFRHDREPDPGPRVFQGWKAAQKGHNMAKMPCQRRGCAFGIAHSGATT